MFPFLCPSPGSPDGQKRAALFSPISTTYDADHSKLTCKVTESPLSNTLVLVKGTVTKN